jgi:hypothetical protein
MDPNELSGLLVIALIVAQRRCLKLAILVSMSHR